MAIKHSVAPENAHPSAAAPAVPRMEARGGGRTPATALAYPYERFPEPGETISVARGIHWLRMPLPFALDHINLWLIRDGDAWTQVDCGYGDADTRALWNTHFDAALEGRSLRRVIATHCHPDHVGNAAWLTSRFDCPLVMTQSEFLTAHALADEHSGFGTARTVSFFLRHGCTADTLRELEARGNPYRRGVPELPVAYERIIPGDTIVMGERTWTVIAGYGHSPEHAALYCASEGVLIAGDMLLPRISTNVSVGPAEPDGDPLKRFLASLESFVELPADTLVLPSHGLPFRGIAFRVGALRAHHAARLLELEAALEGEMTASDLVPILFRRPLDVHQRFFAVGEAIAHLNYLYHADRVERRVDEDGTIRFARSDPKT